MEPHPCPPISLLCVLVLLRPQTLEQNPIQLGKVSRKEWLESQVRVKRLPRPLSVRDSQQADLEGLLWLSLLFPNSGCYAQGTAFCISRCVRQSQPQHWRSAHVYSSQNYTILGAWDFCCSFGKLTLEFRRTAMITKVQISVRYPFLVVLLVS